MTENPFAITFDRSRPDRELLEELTLLFISLLGTMDGPNKHDPFMQTVLVDLSELTDEAVTRRVDKLAAQLLADTQPWVCVSDIGDPMVAKSVREMFPRFATRYPVYLARVIAHNPNLLYTDEMTAAATPTERENDGIGLPFVTPSGRDLVFRTRLERDYQSSHFAILAPGADLSDQGPKFALEIRVTNVLPGSECEWFVEEVDQEFADLLGIPGVGIYSNDWRLAGDEDEDDLQYRRVTDVDLEKIFALLDRPPSTD